MSDDLKDMKALRLPVCRFCGRVWHPQEGVVAAKSFCRACSGYRRSLAIKDLGAKPPVRSPDMGPYTLPPAQESLKLSDRHLRADLAVRAEVDGDILCRAALREIEELEAEVELLKKEKSDG